MHALVEEIRVESKHAIHPRYRLPHSPVRELGGLVAPRGLEPPLAVAPLAILGHTAPNDCVALVTAVCAFAASMRRRVAAPRGDSIHLCASTRRTPD